MTRHRIHVAVKVDAQDELRHEPQNRASAESKSRKKGPSRSTLWPRILVRAGVVALCLITGVPAATRPIRSSALQVSDHQQWQPGSVGGVQFWIVGNEEFLLSEVHFRCISIFVEPGALTADNAKAIFNYFSELYPAEDRLTVEVLTNDQQVGEAESWFGEALHFHFGNVLPLVCRGLPQERVSADYLRSDLTESFHCYSCRGDGKQPGGDLRNPSTECEVRGEGPVDLLEAANRGCKDVVEWLLDRGVDPNVKAAHGGVPLVEAARWKRTEVVKLLLERGASVNLTSSAGWTALMAAASRDGSGTAIDLLLRRGAAVNLHSQDGKTALMLAAQHQDSEVLKQLLVWGADVNAVDGYGNTVLDYALGNDKADKVELLKRAGAIR